MRSCQRARWAALLTCGALIAVATPANAQTRQADAVALARTLADGFTAIDARRPQAQAAVDAWLAEQGRCAEPRRFRSRFRRSTFTAVRWTGLHIVALRALAPDLEQLTQRLRALPVTDSAIRGGIREVLLDYRNARRLMMVEPPDLCAIVRSLRRGDPWAKGIGYSEDVRGSIRGLDRRANGLRAAQRALLRVEVDPRLARSLESVFEHATAGLYRSRLQTGEHLAPPFPIVTDAAGLARLRDEAVPVAAAADRLLAARRGIGRRLGRSLRRSARCLPALEEAIDRRPNGLVRLIGGYFAGELAAAAEAPVERFLADLSVAGVADPALTDLLARTSVQLAWIPEAPRTNLCSKLRAWRRANWKRGAIDLGSDVLGADVIEGGVDDGIRLEEIDRAVLRRRGVDLQAATALASPLVTLVEGLAGDQASTSTQAVASSVRPASAAVTSRGVWRIAQAIGADAIGNAGAR